MTTKIKAKTEAVLEFEPVWTSTSNIVLNKDRGDVFALGPDGALYLLMDGTAHKVGESLPEPNGASKRRGAYTDMERKEQQAVVEGVLAGIGIFTRPRELVQLVAHYEAFADLTPGAASVVVRQALDALEKAGRVERQGSKNRPIFRLRRASDAEQAPYATGSAPTMLLGVEGAKVA